MSAPNIPVVPPLAVDRTAAASLTLASIGFENLGLAHIINAEGEKIQAAVARFNSNAAVTITINDLLNINASVTTVLRDVIKKEIVQEFTLEELIRIFTI